MSCYDTCARCGAAVYLEHLNTQTDVTPDDNWDCIHEPDDLDDLEGTFSLCHCCTIELGFAYRPYEPPTYGTLRGNTRKKIQPRRVGTETGNVPIADKGTELAQ